MSDKSDLRVRGYIVIALVDSTDKKYQGCRVIPEGEIYPANYKQVYGPDSQKDCEKWAAAHCDKKAAS